MLNDWRRLHDRYQKNCAMCEYLVKRLLTYTRKYELLLKTICLFPLEIIQNINYSAFLLKQRNLPVIKKTFEIFWTINNQTQTRTLPKKLSIKLSNNEDVRANKEDSFILLYCIVEKQVKRLFKNTFSFQNNRDKKTDFILTSAFIIMGFFSYYFSW